LRKQAFILRAVCAGKILRKAFAHDGKQLIDFCPVLSFFGQLRLGQMLLAAGLAG
jgi:hypothetical protein